MVLRAASLIFVSQVLTTAILFLRNVLIARLIGVEDFGIAATFSILFAVIEMISNLSEVKLVVQDREGDTKRFTDTLHSVRAIRGALSTGLLLVLAGPYARLVQTPDLVWAYQYLALIPLARGFMHLDVFRLQRHMRFKPFAINSVAGPTIGLAVALAAVWLQDEPDYTVMLWAIIAHQLALTILSHVQAERRFGLAWDGVYVRRTLRFGLPLLGNAMLMLLILQGERIIVANQFDLATLGWFSAAFMLATAPSRILLYSSNGIFLPKLARLQDDPERFRPMATLTMEIGLLIGLGTAVGLTLLGPAALVGLFGPAYAPGLTILVLFGLQQGVRIARAAPNAVAMAAGHTPALLYASILRAMAIPIAFAIVLNGGRLESVVLVGLAFEALAMAYGLWLMRRRTGVPLGPLVVPILTVSAVMGLILADLWLWPPTVDLIANLHAFQLVVVLTAMLSVLALPLTRGRARQFVARRTAKGRGGTA